MLADVADQGARGRSVQGGQIVRVPGACLPDSIHRQNGSSVAPDSIRIGWERARNLCSVSAVTPASLSWRAAREVGAKPRHCVSTPSAALRIAKERCRPGGQRIPKPLDSVRRTQNLLNDSLLRAVQVRAAPSAIAIACCSGSLTGSHLAPPLSDAAHDLSFSCDGSGGL